MNTYNLTAHASSAQNDGVAVTAGGATIILGGAANTKHAHLRFDTSSISASDVIMSAKMSVLVSSITGSPSAIDLWASNFGAAITIADYNLSESNVSGASFRKKITQAFSSSHIAGTFMRTEIPSWYITPGGSNYSDFELRPSSAVAGTTTIHGAGATGAIVLNTDETAVVSGQKPTLNIVTATTVEEATQNTYRNFVTGAESYLAFDIETTPGTPVKGMYMLDMTGTDLDIQADNLVSGALRRERAKPSKVVLGAAGGGGSFSFELTPEKMWLLLLGFLKWTSTSGSISTTVTAGAATAIQALASTTGMTAGDVLWFNSSQQAGTILTVDSGVQVTLTAAPSTTTITGETVYGGVFTNTFKVAQSDQVKTYTFVKGEGRTFREVYCGCMLGSMTINASYGAIVTGSCSVDARRVFRYDTNASGGEGDPYILNTSAGYDSNLVLSFVGAQIEFDDVANRGTIPSMTVSFNNSVRPVTGLRRRRDITSHSVQSFVVDVSFDLEFENDAQYRKFIGVNHAKYPHLPETEIITQKVELLLAGPDGDTTQEIVLTIPKMLFTTVRKPIGGEGNVMLSCSGMATFDTVSNTNITVTVKNTHDPSFYGASTDTISVIPPDVTFP